MKWRKIERKIKDMLNIDSGEPDVMEAIDSLDDRLSVLQREVDAIEKEVADISHNLVNRNTIIVGQDKRLADHDKLLDDLDRRIAALGKDVADNIRILDHKTMSDIHDLREAMLIKWSEPKGDSGSSKVKAATRRKPVPKYRNPDNPDQTWSGRGHVPSWMRVARARGVSDQELLISGGNSEGSV